MDLRLGTWNTRTLYRAGALTSLLETVETYKVDVLALQEMRWTGTGTLDKRSHSIYYSCNESQHIDGVGFIVNQRTKGLIIDFKAYSQRMCYLRLKGKFFNYSLVNAHAPTDDKSDEIKEQFFEDLEQAYRRCPRNDIKIVLGDMNARIGRERVFMPTIGRHSLHNISSDNGLRLINLAAALNMTVASTYFEHKNIHKVTWTSPDGRTTSQIDHILIDSRHGTDVINCRSYRGANIDSDHCLVISTLRARISNISKENKRARKKWNVQKLKDATVAERYSENITNRLRNQNVNEEGQIDIDSYWTTIKEDIEAAAKDEIGTENCDRKNHWFDDECKNATKEKNEAYRKMLTRRTRTTVENYQTKRREEKRIHKRKKRNHLNKELKYIENLNKDKEFRAFYKKVNINRKEFKATTSQCRSQNGDLLTTTKDVLNRWVEYFNQALNIEEEEENLDDERDEVSEIDEREEEPPTIHEIKDAVKKLARNKSPGIDNLPAELYKEGGHDIIMALQQLIKEIWTQKSLPNDWNIGILCTIHKKGDIFECSNHRGITLLNAAYKIFSTVLCHRMAPYAERIVGKYQAGFRGGKSTIHQISTLRQILEKTLEYGIDTHHVFIDYKAAYDSVNRREMFKAMKELGIPNQLVNLTKLTLEKVECRVRIQGELSEPFKTNNGLRQGDPLSCILFNLALEKVIRMSQITTIGSIYNKSVQILAYADDINIVGRTENAVREVYVALKESATKMGLIININKTKYMKISTHPQTLQPLVIENDVIEAVNEFVYLGALINSENNTTAEINRRICTANRCYFGLNRLLKSSIISRNTKVKLYKTIIRPVLTYGSETWTLTKSNENMLGCFERKVLRRIYGAVNDNGVWRRRYNFELYRIYQEPDIVKHVKIGRLRWIGHVMRMEQNDPARKTLLDRPIGQRRRGRPRTRFLDNIDEDMRNMGIRAWRRKAMDRDDWREILEEARTHAGL